jgi:hypothetical protein
MYQDSFNIWLAKSYIFLRDEDLKQLAKNATDKNIKNTISIFANIFISSINKLLRPFS